MNAESTRPDGDGVDPSEVLDLKAARERIPGGPEAIGEMAELLFSECDRMLTSLRAAIPAGDAKAVKIAAHTVKGGVGVFEGKRVYDIAHRLEMMGKSGDLTEAAAVMDELEVELKRFRTALASAIK